MTADRPSPTGRAILAEAAAEPEPGLMNSAAEEAMRCAINLGRNCGYHVFPVGDDKRPAIAGWPERASADPEAIWRLWHERPGSLIGVVTGARSGVSVLDVDPHHEEAGRWWRANHQRVPATRTFRSRRGGFHLYFQHRNGIANTQGRIAPGVDSRGRGGFIIFWFASGYECLDFAPIARWPDWLAVLLIPQPSPPAPGWNREPDPDRAIDGLLEWLGGQPDGTRNAGVFWVACRLAERGMGQAHIETLLLPVAHSLGLTRADEVREVRATIASALKRSQRVE
jgi:hypothetical protein